MGLSLAVLAFQLCLVVPLASCFLFPATGNALSGTVLGRNIVVGERGVAAGGRCHGRAASLRVPPIGGRRAERPMDQCAVKMSGSGGPSAMDRVSDKVKSALAMASMGWGGNEDVLARAVDDMVVVISRRSERYPNEDDLQAMLVSVSAITVLACTPWPYLWHAHESHKRMGVARCDPFLCLPLSLFPSQWPSLFLYSCLS
jgi:hypothetical protein